MRQRGKLGVLHYETLLDLNVEQLLEREEEQPGGVHNGVIEFEDAARAEQAEELGRRVLALEREDAGGKLGRADVRGFAAVDAAVLLDDFEKPEPQPRPAFVAHIEIDVALFAKLSIEL